MYDTNDHDRFSWIYDKAGRSGTEALHICVFHMQYRNSHSTF
jgi:hypothetical protein